MRNGARWALAAAAASALATLVALRSARSRTHEDHSVAAIAVGPAATAFDVPRATAAVKLDGELSEPEWIHLAARTGGFVDPAGAKAIPFSEGRIMWQGDRLLLALYAADIDIETAPDAGAPNPKADVFELTFRRGEHLYSLSVAAGGAREATQCAADGWMCRGDPTPWDSGAEVGIDVDGTPNRPNDDDEEWVLEVALPLRALGLEPRAGERIDLRLRRCDFPRGAGRACGSWSAGRAGTIALKG